MNTKRKLIITTHTYYPYKDGVAIVNDYLTKGMVKKGYEVVVITYEEDHLTKEEYHDGIRILRVFKENSPQDYVKCIKSLVSEKDTLVNVCTQTPTTDFLLSELRGLKCRKVLYVHGIIQFKWSAENCSSMHNFLSKIYSDLKWKVYYSKLGKYINDYDAIIHLHENDDGYLFFKRKYGCDGWVIENAAEDRCFEYSCSAIAQEKYGIDSPYAICISNYYKGKNQEMVLRAFSEYYNNDNSLKSMVFVGRSTEYLDYLKKIYIELRAKKPSLNVVFLNDISRDDTLDLLKQAYCFVFGSKVEKFPVVIVEAMAAGVPFISTDVGVVKYFPGGIIVKNTEEMAQSICRLANDQELHDTLSKEGAEYARRRMRICDKVDAFEKICFGKIR